MEFHKQNAKKYLKALIHLKMIPVTSVFSVCSYFELFLKNKILTVVISMLPPALN